MRKILGIIPALFVLVALMVAPATGFAQHNDGGRHSCYRTCEREYHHCQDRCAEMRGHHRKDCFHECRREQRHCEKDCDRHRHYR